MFKNFTATKDISFSGYMLVPTACHQQGKKNKKDYTKQLLLGQKLYTLRIWIQNLGSFRYSLLHEPKNSKMCSCSKAPMLRN